MSREDSNEGYPCSVCGGVRDKVEQLQAELADMPMQTRCRVCDTIECGTMYCRKCYNAMMEERDSLVVRLPHDALGNVLMPPARMWTAEGERFCLDGVEYRDCCWFGRDWDRVPGLLRRCDELYPTREAAEQTRISMAAGGRGERIAGDS